MNWLARLRPQRSKTFYRQLFIIFGMAVTPVMLLAFSAYFVGVSQVERQVEYTQQLQLEQLGKDIAEDLRLLEHHVRNAGWKDIFGEKLRTYDYYNDLAANKLILSALSALESSPLVGKAEFYLAEANMLLSNADGLRMMFDAQEIALYEELFRHERMFEWLYGVKGLVLLQQKLPADVSIGASAYGALFVQLDIDALNKMVSQVNPYGEGWIGMFSPHGDLVASSDHSTVREEQAVVAGLWHEITASGLHSDSRVIEVDGRTYSIGFSTYTRNEWIYVIATPLDALTKPVTAIARYIVSFTAIALLLVCISAWFVSNKLYEPISRLFQVVFASRVQPHTADKLALIEERWKQINRETRLLQQKHEEHIPMLKKSFLHQFVNGHFYSYSEAELQSLMLQYGWDVTDKSFMFAYIRLAGTGRLAGSFTDHDDELLTFAAVNIVEELTATESFATEVVNFHNLAIGVFTFFDAAQTETAIKRDMYELGKQIARMLTSLLNVQAIIVLSGVSRTVKELPRLVEDTQMASRFRDVNESHWIESADDILPRGEYTAYYPFELDKELIHALRMGNKEECIRLLYTFCEELKQHSRQELYVQNGLFQLLGSIQHAIVSAGFHPSQRQAGSTLYERMAEQKEPEAMMRWLSAEVIVPFIDDISANQNVKMRQAVEKVAMTIHEQYMNDLSLEQCAEVHGINPFMLSKAFRQIMNINFIDYLTSYRLQKAKELLRETELKVNEIAEAVGYHGTYFFRAFKKYEDMTPTQYREKYSNSTN